MICFLCESFVKLTLTSLKISILTILPFPSKRYLRICLKIDSYRAEQAHPMTGSFYLRLEGYPDPHQIFR